METAGNALQRCGAFPAERSSMKWYGKLCREWKRTLCLTCSFALVLSAVPAKPVLAEGTAGQESLAETGSGGTETAGDTEGAGQTEESAEETARPENNGEDGIGQNPGGDGMEETGQNPGNVENTEGTAADQGKTETETRSDRDSEPDKEDSGGNMADAETDIASDMGVPAAEEDGAAGRGSEMENGETEETEETAMPYSLDNAYTDTQGNVFHYVLDEGGNVVITGITLSGQALEIPDSINGAAVAAVSSGSNSCVVSNPETAIPSLYVNCGSVGAYVFSGLHIGTLTVGEKVACFEESTEDGGSSHYWSQFAGSTVGKMCFYAPNLVMGHTQEKGLTNYMYGPFEGAAVGEIEIGAGVVSIPEYLLYGAKMEMERLEIHAATVGAYAFASENISIGELTVGKEVSQFLEDYYSSDILHHWNQFKGVAVGRLRYDAPDLSMMHTAGTGLTNYMYGPFEGAAVGEIEIGAGVVSIPEYLLYGAKMEMERLEIHAATVGAYAFASENISIGELTVGKEVSQFLEDYYSSDTSHHWNQFKGVTVGKLCYAAPDLSMMHTAGTGLTNYMYGPFEGAAIGEIEIDKGVISIPEYLLYEAKMEMDALEIHAATVGAYAFASKNISIGELTVGREVSQFLEDYYSSDTSHHWNQFKGVAVGKLRYDAPDLAMVHTAGTGLTNYIYGPFEGAGIGALEIGADVEVIPEYFLYNAFLTTDALEIHVPKIGAYAFAGSGISIGTLTLGEEVAEFTEDIYSSSSAHYWKQFAGVKVGKLKFSAINLVTVHTKARGLTNNIYAPFEGASIGALEIGIDVEAVPEYFLYNALFTADALEIHVPKIGAYAFAGSGISIGTLTIGREVAALSEDYYSTVNSHYWNQFLNGRFGRVVYAADCAAAENSVASYGTNSTYIYGPFQKSEIGTLVIADNVECIPDYLFYNAKMALDSLTINVPVIGAQAFQGAGIAIKTLTVGERVRHLAAAKYGSSSYRYWQQFRDADIGAVNYNAVSAVLDGSGTGANFYYSPFYKTGIDALNLGDGVDVIPAFLFYEAILEQEELAIHARAVGSSAFYSSGISIGVLTIGEEVEELSFVKSGSYYYFRQFGGMEIGTLIYEPKYAATGASCSAGPFHNAHVGSVSFGSSVAVVPNYLFYNAKIAFGDFTVNIPTVGCYSFSGPDISFGNLTIGENVSSFLVNAGNYSRAFDNSTVEGSLNYNAKAARLDTEASSTYGPFYDIAAGSLSVGENVRFLDRRLFRGNRFESCTVYAVAVSEEHMGQTLTASYLPASKYLNIHHNSGFADYFTAKAEEIGWMCRDFFTVTYGDKVFDEDSGEYMVEVMRECSVCGYTEGGFEDLDDSYEVHLSIPVEVPLLFSESKKSYEGSAEVYAYGRLGNAYEGVRLSVDSAAENFGLAETGGEKVDVSTYLAAGFSSGSEAVFTPAQVLGNGEAFSNGDMEKLYMDSLAVSVKGIAFLRSGTGNYAIPIPLRVEIF